MALTRFKLYRDKNGVMMATVMITMVMMMMVLMTKMVMANIPKAIKSEDLSFLLHGQDFRKPNFAPEKNN